MTDQEVLVYLGDPLNLYKIYGRLIGLTSLPGVDKVWGSLYCPFHDDQRHPSAKIYKDSDQIERIYCWVCARQFNSYDFVKKVLRKNPLTYALGSVGMDYIKHTIEKMGNEEPVIANAELQYALTEGVQVFGQHDVVGFINFIYERVALEGPDGR